MLSVWQHIPLSPVRYRSDQTLPVALSSGLGYSICRWAFAQGCLSLGQCSGFRGSGQTAGFVVFPRHLRGEATCHSRLQAICTAPPAAHIENPGQRLTSCRGRKRVPSTPVRPMALGFADWSAPRVAGRDRELVPAPTLAAAVDGPRTSTNRFETLWNRWRHRGNRCLTTAGQTVIRQSLPN